MLLCQAEDNATHFGKFKPGHFIDVGLDSEEKWRFEKRAQGPRGQWDRMAKHGFLLVEANHILQKGRLENESANTHFTACGTSNQMLADLILSSNELSAIHGLADYLQRVQHTLCFSVLPQLPSTTVYRRHFVCHQRDVMSRIRNQGWTKHIRKRQG